MPPTLPISLYHVFLLLLTWITTGLFYVILWSMYLPYSPVCFYSIMSALATLLYYVLHAFFIMCLSLHNNYLMVTWLLWPSTNFLFIFTILIFPVNSIILDPCHTWPPTPLHTLCQTKTEHLYFHLSLHCSSVPLQYCPCHASLHVLP